MDNIYKEIEEQKKRGVLIVLSGPSGAGKDVLIAALSARNKRLVRLVTTTTRSPRPDEVNGREYYFVDRLSFEKLIAGDGFFEWVEYRGNLYGGQKKHVEEAIKSGKDVVWRIDVKGVKNIKEKIIEMVQNPNSPINNVVFVFLTGPTLEIMEERMRRRGTENHKWQKWSKDMAKWEMEQFNDFDYLVVNYDSKLEEAVEKVRMVIEVARLRIKGGNKNS